MNVGTKSVLFGAHCFFIHPLMLWRAWTKLYGFPWDPRYYFAFFLHDFGYLGKPNMDGEEGQTHPEFGANIMRWLFGDVWGDFCLFHSRRYAKVKGKEVSRLCVADKLATSLMPAWLFIPMTSLTGELQEYMKPDADPNFESPEYINLVATTRDPYAWFAGLKLYMDGVIEKMNKDALSIEDLWFSHYVALKEQRKKLLVDKYVLIYGEQHRQYINETVGWYDDRTKFIDYGYTLEQCIRYYCSSEQ